MAITDEQYNRLLSRIDLIEETINDLLTVTNKTITASSLSKVVTIFETTLDDIRDRLTTLEEEVDAINSQDED